MYPFLRRLLRELAYLVNPAVDYGHRRTLAGERRARRRAAVVPDRRRGFPVVVPVAEKITSSPPS